MTDEGISTASAARFSADKLSYISAILITLLDGVGLGVLLPMLPFLVLHFGGSPAIVTQLVAFYSLASFLADPIMGRLSDRIGRASLIIVSLVGTIVAYVGILFSWSLLSLFVFRILSGALAGRAPAIRAMVTDDVPKERHIERLSWLGAVTAIGSALGPVLASVAASLSPEPALQYRATILAAIGLTVLSLVLALLAKAVRTRQPAAATAAAQAAGGPVPSRFAMMRELRVPLVLAATTSYGYGVLLSTTAIFVHFRFGWTVVETGRLLTVVAAAVAVGRLYLLPRLTKMLGLERTLAALLALSIVALVCAGLTTSVWLFCASIALYSGACALAVVVPTTLVSAAARPSYRGYSLGIAAATSAIAAFLSASLNGVFFQFLAPYAPHLIGASVMAVGLAVLMTRRPAAAPAVTRP